MDLEVVAVGAFCELPKKRLQNEAAKKRTKNEDAKKRSAVRFGCESVACSATRQKKLRFDAGDLKSCANEVEKLPRLQDQSGQTVTI